MATSLEKQVLSAAQKAIHESIGSCLNGYNSPLNKFIIEVVNAHETELRQIIEENLKQAILSDDFKKAAKDAFTHKLAKTLVAKIVDEQLSVKKD